jgi:pimeloyl-ACP methyl ester carboxylesterase
MLPMKLFYRKYGSGPPLIILHGLFGSSDNWVSIAKSLNDRFTVFLPDLRNHGQSPHSSIHSYESLREDLYDFANELGLAKFFLAGHSMGGKAAAYFALNWPEKLYGLLVADISPLAQKDRKTGDYYQHLAILDFMLSVNISEITTRAEIESVLITRISSEKVRDLILKNLKREPDNSFSWKLNAPALFNNLDRMLEGIGSDDTASTEITGFPVFFLKGEFSDYLPEKDFTNIRKLFPAAEFIVIPGAGHWIHSDNPGMVKKCILKLLGNS